MTTLLLGGLVLSTRINMLVPDHLLKEIDQRAKELNLTRTAFILSAISQKMQQDEMIRCMPQLLLAMQNMNETKDEEKK